jgi:hypothetical protein
LLLGISLTANVLLGFAYLRLSTVGGTLNAEPRRGPEIGATIPSFVARRWQGDVEQISFGAGPPTLLYVFSPKCHWCRRNMANWRSLVEAARSSHRIIALSLDPNVEEFIRAEPLNVPVYVEPSPETTKALMLQTTPHTVRISAQGRVVGSWLGAYTGKTGEEIEQFFKFRLPGVGRDLDRSVQ